MRGTYGAPAVRRTGAEYGKRVTETDINSWGKQKRERGLNRKGQSRKRWKRICGTIIICMIEDRLVSRSS